MTALWSVPCHSAEVLNSYQAEKTCGAALEHHRNCPHMPAPFICTVRVQAVLNMYIFRALLTFSHPHLTQLLLRLVSPILILLHSQRRRCVVLRLHEISFPCVVLQLQLMQVYIYNYVCVAKMSCDSQFTYAICVKLLVSYQVT